MLVRVRSVAHVGLTTIPVEVEVDVASKGFPGFNIVGLANKAIEEAKERVKTAIVMGKLNLGLQDADSLLDRFSGSLRATLSYSEQQDD